VGFLQQNGKLGFIFAYLKAADPRKNAAKASRINVVVFLRQLLTRLLFLGTIASLKAFLQFQGYEI